MALKFSNAVRVMKKLTFRYTISFFRCKAVYISFSQRSLLSDMLTRDRLLSKLKVRSNGLIVLQVSANGLIFFRGECEWFNLFSR
jgi:hypothetical protein